MAIFITFGAILFAIGTFLNMFKMNLGAKAGVWNNIKEKWQESKGLLVFELVLAAIFAPLGFLPI